MELKALKISDKKIALLNSMGIGKAEDLLTYYPFRYEQIEFIPYENWEKGGKVALEGTIITRASVFRYGYHKSITRFKIDNEAGEFDIALFNRPWPSTFAIGKKITIIGKYEGGSKITALQYNFNPLAEQLGIEPVYTVKEGITQKDIRNYIRKAYDALSATIENVIPQPFLDKYRLIDRKDAIYGVHHPNNSSLIKQSLRHLKYEEFFKFQFTMQLLKQVEKTAAVKSGKQFDNEDVWELKKTLRFDLTSGQVETIQDILNDMHSESIMYRMVQGDVGCGKTLVAAFGMYACVLAHKQAALMAPTEILAKQHGDNLKQLFQDFDVQVEVLYASLGLPERRAVLKRLANNEIDILVGTHALFQEEVQFYDLGMVVADEQHRFGVEQRRRLLDKGDKVDFLLMSATPIPRTLAMSLFGDMDVSTISELPKGRMPVTTKLIKANSMQPILQDVLKQIDDANQCYIVCPAIEKNEEFAVRNVTDIYDALQSAIGRKYRIALLHGRMNSQQKDSVMHGFAAHAYDILVSTTVIEVGIDVKDANIMVIYDAHRFGLSQIHQLRGRVGRGTRPGYCYLLTSTKDPDSLKRLEICERTNDGFEIARADLQIRGPGDILGTRQSGIPGFILGDVIADANILEVARADAAYALKHAEEPAFAPLYQKLKEQLDETRYLD